MVIRLGSTVINCADLDLMTRFWSQALHLRPAAEDGDEFRVLRGEHVNASCSGRAPWSVPATRCTSTCLPTIRSAR